MSRAAARTSHTLPPISAEEVDRRRELIRRADHENELEGQTRDPATDHIFEAYIQGKIDLGDVIPLLKEFHASGRA